MLADTLTLNSTTVVDVRFGMLRLGLRPAHRATWA